MNDQQDNSLGLRGWIIAILMMSGAYVQFEPAPFDALAILCTVGWAMGFCFRWAKHFQWLGLFLVPYMLAQLGGVLISADAAKSVPVALVTIYLAALVPILASLAHNRRWNVAEALYRGTLIAGVVSSIACTLAYVGALPGGDFLLLFSRATGGFKDPNVFAAWLVPPFLFAYSRGFESKGREGLIYLLCSAVCGVGLLLAFSRGAWGQTAVGLFVVYALMRLTPDPEGRPRKARPVMWIIVAFCALLAVVYFSQNEDFIELWTMRFGKQDYDQERFSAHANGWAVGARHFFGVGPGLVSRTVGMNVHNNFLHTLLESGWIGLASFMGFLIASIARATRYAIVAPCSRDRLYFRVAAASLIGLAAESWIIDIFHWRHFWYMAAVAWFPVRAVARTRPTAQAVSDESEKDKSERDQLFFEDEARW